MFGFLKPKSVIQKRVDAAIANKIEAAEERRRLEHEAIDDKAHNAKVELLEKAEVEARGINNRRDDEKQKVEDELVAQIVK